MASCNGCSELSTFDGCAERESLGAVNDERRSALSRHFCNNRADERTIVTMPMHEHRSIGFKLRGARRSLVVIAAVCLTGLVYLACLPSQPLQATAEPNDKSATSIRLGQPAFEFRPSGPVVSSRQSQLQQQQLAASRSDINIRSQGSPATSAVPKNSNWQPRIYSTSQQLDSQKQPVDRNDGKENDFWRRVVTGQATQLNEPPNPNDPESGMRLPEAPSLGSESGGPNHISEEFIEPGSRNGSPVPPIPQRPRNPQLGVPQFGVPQAVTPEQSVPLYPNPPYLNPPSETFLDLAPPPDVNSPSPNFGANQPSPLKQPSVTSGHSFYKTQPGMSGFRATVEKDATNWISPYAARADQAVTEMNTDLVPALEAMPKNFHPWWDSIVRKAVNPRAATMQVNVSNLIKDALLYSPQVVAIQAEPEVLYRIITQEAARFDWTAFLETTYNDQNDPIGNELTAGAGRDRLITRQWQFSGGVRRRNEIGGEIEVSQDFGHENQNSIFFTPNNQASSRLELSYRQPLLDGAGRAFNQSEIVLARIEANSSEDEVVDALQDHLIQVTTAYWTLYRSRAEFFQRQKLLISSQDVLDRLQGRAQVDTIPRQILRAQAAVARAKTGIRRTLAQVKDSEAQLRLLVNSPGMLNGGPIELLPLEAPESTTESADLRSILQTALFNRADISAAIRQMRAAGVRLGVSKTELLPRLDFLVSTYVADLSGGSNLGSALRGQYTDNRPGYSVGFEFEVPLGNRAARARNEQRQWELKRAINVFRATVERSLTDVEIGRREVETAHAEMISRYHSMSAANQESIYLKDRFDVFPEAENSAILLLEDLLNSFERLANEESDFVRAQVDHALALIELKQVMGTLLRSRHDRPSIDSSHQKWVQERLQTRAPGPVDQSRRSVANARLNDRTTSQPDANARQQTGNTGGQSSSAASLSDEQISRLRAQAHEKSKIQQTSAQRSADLSVPRREPIPAYPTTWSRNPSNR